MMTENEKISQPSSNGTVSFDIPGAVMIPDQRLEGYDIARSFAFFGMVLVNFWALMDINVSCPDWLTFVLGMIQGRAAAAFVILAGVGLSLLTRKAYLSHDPALFRTARFRIWRRAVFLLALGLLNAIIWPADILHFYALYFAVGGVLAFYSNERLMALIVTPVLTFALLMTLFEFDQGQDWGALSFGEWFNPVRVARHFFFNGYYPLFPWISFMIIGIWLGRQDLHDVRLRRKIVLAGICGVVVSECFSWVVYYVAESPDYPWSLEAILPWADIDPWEPMPLFMISAGGTALVAIITLVAWADHFKRARWLKPFVAAGQSTLTLYILHIVMAEAGIRTMKLWRMDSSLFPIVGGGLFFGISLLGCHFWKKHFQRGPLEWVMRGFFDVSFFRRARAL